MILRAADSLIGRGGRTLLTRVLKGSREKSVLEHDLDRNPAYGYFRELPTAEVAARVDWAITHRYLDVVYDHRLPLLVFAPRGWAIEKETISDEFLRELDRRLAAGSPYDMSDLKDRNRDVIVLLLEKIERSGRVDLVPLLDEWQSIDYKKVRARIRQVIRSLTEGE